LSLDTIKEEQAIGIISDTFDQLTDVYMEMGLDDYSLYA